MVNIFSRKIPERLSNFVKGLFSIVSALPLAFLIYVFVLSILPWSADSSNTLAIVIATVVFLTQFSFGIYMMMQKAEK